MRISQKLSLAVAMAVPLFGSLPATAADIPNLDGQGCEKWVGAMFHSDDCISQHGKDECQRYYRDALDTCNGVEQGFKEQLIKDRNRYSKEDMDKCEREAPEYKSGGGYVFLSTCLHELYKSKRLTLVASKLGYKSVEVSYAYCQTRAERDGYRYDKCLEDEEWAIRAAKTGLGLSIVDDAQVDRCVKEALAQQGSWIVFNRCLPHL